MTLLCLGALLCLCSAEAQAAPDNGFGLYIGALSSRDSVLYGNGNGGLIQADVQFIVNEHWSLNPYLLLGTESTDTNGYDIETGEGGLQARYWMDESLFLGAQFLFHDNLLTKGSTVSSSLYGPGIGLGAGWEGGGHWSIAVATNVYSLARGYGASSTTRTEAMLIVGYHWY